MPKYRIIKLKNLTPIHVGTGKENYDFSSGSLHSDTLSSALAAIRALKGKTSDLKEFLDSFTISSAFPYYKEKLFLPRNQGKLNLDIIGEERDVRKRLKKIKFIEQEVWSDIVKGGKPSVDMNQILDGYISFSTELKTLTKSFTSQRVSISRGDAGKTEPFFFEWKFYDPKSGMYCIIDSDSNTFDEIKELFTELGINGLGTDKNVGGGKFEVEEDSIELPDVPDANSLALLSLYIPSEDELDKLELHSSKYELLHRGGYIAGSSNEEFRHLRKKTVYMFSVGSVFKTTALLKGKVVNLRPEWNDDRLHPIYRSGKPFYLPVKTTDYE